MQKGKRKSMNNGGEVVSPSIYIIYAHISFVRTHSDILKLVARETEKYWFPLFFFKE